MTSTKHKVPFFFTLLFILSIPTSLFGQFSLSPSSVVVGPTAGQRSVLLSGSGAWTATSDVAWLHVSTANGTGGQVFTFHFDADTLATRTGTITFNGGGLILTVNQAGPGYFPAGVPADLFSVPLGTGLEGMAVDILGNVYWADPYNQVLQKWTAATGVISTLVNSGLYSDSGVAVDTAGNVYYANAITQTVKKWSAATQQVTTLVSSGLLRPSALAIDAAGNLYIGDTGNNAIKRWDAVTQQVSTVLTCATPFSVAVDGDGNVYAGSNPPVVWFAATQQTAVLDSSGPTHGMAADGSGNAYYPLYSTGAFRVWDVTTKQARDLVSVSSNGYNAVVDGAGNIYMTGRAIQVVKIAYMSLSPVHAPSGGGSGALPPVVPASTTLSATSDQSWLTIGAIANGIVNYTVSANPSATVRTAHITMLGQSITVTQAANFALATQAVNVGPAAGSNSVSLSAGGAWTAAANASWLHLSSSNSSGTGNQTVVFTYDANSGSTRTGTITFNNGALTLTVTQLGNSYAPVSAVTTLVSSGLNGPNAVAVDGAGNVVIADTLNDAIKRWNASTGQVTTLVSSGLHRPLGVAADAVGNVYFTDDSNNAAGGYIKQWSAATQAASTLIGSGLSNPAQLAVDLSGNLFFNATTAGYLWTCTVQSGQVSQVTSQAGIANGVAVDNQGKLYFSEPASSRLLAWTAANPNVNTQLAAGLNQGAGVAVDANGNVYVADAGSNSIKQWNAVTQQFTTVVSAGLSQPEGVAVDGAGNLYIADTGNNAVKRVAAAFVDSTPLYEPAVSGSDSAALVFPASTSATAASDQSWLTIGGVASGVVRFSFATNTTTASRVAHIQVLGQSVTVTQAAGGALSIGTSTVVLGPGAGPGSVLLNASLPWTASSNASWLHLATGSTSGTDGQTILFTCDANSGATRTGTITFNGTAAVNVTQAGSGFVRAGLVIIPIDGLTSPRIAAVDGPGNLYLLDYDPVQLVQRLKKWDASTHAVSVLATGFGRISGTAIDASGNLYFADYDANDIFTWNATTKQLTPIVATGFRPSAWPWMQPATCTPATSTA